ncbi:MAG: hypothetical protein GKR90_27770 [Pseudomonadales bacterium]|nr:hypothetical protein [Pseudomonadales bacterium]
MTERDNIRKIDEELILQCKDGKFKKVRTLLDEGADPNFVDPKIGMRPIQVAAVMGAFPVLEELLTCENLDMLVTTGDGILPSQLVSTHRLLPAQLETLNKLLDREVAAAEKLGIAHEDLLTRRVEVPVPTPTV